MAVHAIAKLVAAALLGMVAMQTANATGSSPLGDMHYGLATVEEPAPRVLDRTVGFIGQSWLLNGDFETTSSDGSPAYWIEFRRGFFDVDDALARSGERSVRSSFAYGWFQQLSIPVSSYQSFAVAGYATRELPEERAGTRSVFFGSEGGFFKELNQISPIHSPAGSYGQFRIAQEVPEGASTLQLYLRGEAAPSWIRYDDVLMYSEQFGDPALQKGEGWVASGGATVQGNTISLPPGAEVSQHVAAGLDNQAYFVWGRYDASDQTSLTVREDWLPYSSAETTATTSTTVQLAGGEATFVADLDRPLTKPSGLAKVTLAATGPGTVTLTDLRRGFAKVEPATLVAGPASPDGPLKLTAAWPDHLSTATVDILAGGITSLGSATTVTQHGTSVRAEWNPADAPAGEYAARFTMQAVDDGQVIVLRRFQVLREDNATSTIPALSNPEFVRGVWTFAHPHYTAADLLHLFQLLKADGYTFTIILSEPGKLAAIRQAAEASGVEFSVFIPEATKLFIEYTRRSYFSKVDYLNRIKELFAPVIGSPMFKGVYVYDEPSRPEMFDVLRRTNLSITQDGSLGVPFSVFLQDTNAAQFAQVQPPVGLVDVYPFSLGKGGDPTESLLDAILVENARAKELAELGRDMWLLPQAFIGRTIEDSYPVPPTMHTAQLGAAVLSGARGILPFYYNSSNGHNQGMRNSDFSPAPMHKPYRQFNILMDRLGPLLMQLETPELRNDVPWPFAVSRASGPANEDYAFVLNADDDATRTLSITLAQSPGILPFDLVAERSLPLSQGGIMHVELGPGQWAMFSLGKGNSITSMAAQPITEPVLSTIPVPVTHKFTVPRLDGSGQPVLDVDFSPDGTALAASTGLFGFEPNGPMVFHLQPNGLVVRETGPVVFPADRFGTTAGGLFYNASENVGMRLYAEGGFSGEPLAAFEGYTGGAYDVIHNGSSHWISRYHFGLRQLVDTPQGLMSAGTSRGDFGPFSDLFGPFADGSVTAIIGNYGVTNVKPGLVEQHFQQRSPLFGSDKHADLNAEGLLAVPRHQLGVGLFQLDSNGEATLVGYLAEEAVDATAVAWLYNSVLAVADGYRNVRFYAVDNSEVDFIGTWRPETFGNTFILSLAAKGNRLALSTQSGEVFVGDVRALQPDTAATIDWQLLD